MSAPRCATEARAAQRARLGPGPLSALAAICAAALALLATATWRGAAATPDSAVYLSAAQNLAEGHGLLDLGREPLTVFPPVLPALWGLGFALGDERTRTAVAINAAALLACILLAYRASLLLTESRVLALLAAAFVALAPQTWRVFPMAWSDPLYAAATLGFLWLLGRAPPASERDWARIGAAGLLCGALFLVRYTGLALLLAHGLWIWRRSGRQGARAALRFLLLAGLVPAAWMARNLSIDGTLMGPRPWAAETLGGALLSLGSVVGGWLLPLELERSALAAAAVIACGVLAVGVARRRRALAPDGPARHLLEALAIYVVASSIYLVAAARIIAIDPIDERLLSALFAPAVVLAAAAARGHLDAWRLAGVGSARLRLAGAAALVWLTAGAVVSAQVSLERARAGRSLSAAVLESSSFAAALRELPRDQPWFSNHPRLTYWLTRHQPILGTPRKSEYRSDVLPDDFPLFDQRLESAGEHLLVWWLPPPAQMSTLEELWQRGYRFAEPRFFDLGVLVKLEKADPLAPRPGERTFGLAGGLFR